MNTSKVKDTKYEEPSVTDHLEIEVIKALIYFKLFECGKKLFKNLNTTYERVFVENAKESIGINV